MLAGVNARVAGASRGNSGGQKTGAAKRAVRKSAALPLIDLAGYKQMREKYRGKPLVVNFWATWCEPCRTEYPMLVDLAKEYRPKGVVFVGVSFDQDADLGPEKVFLAKYRPPFPNFRQKPGIDVDAFDNAIDPRWTGAIPSTIFYRKNGKPVVQFYGVHPRADYVKVIEELMADPLAARK
jgi:thiol-disulfide isomerase/thioredoxin